MAYSNAEVEPLAQRLVANLPGLDIRLARAWIKSESGVGNNPLGVTHMGPNGKSVLSTYSSRIEGIDAASALLKRSNNYAGIRKAIAGGNLRQQALAIIASPWNRRGSPYYTKVFTRAGFLGANPPPALPTYPLKPPTGAPPTGVLPGDARWESGSAPKTVMLGAWSDLVQIPVGHKLTTGDIADMEAKLNAAGWFGTGYVADTARSAFRDVMGRHVGDVWNKSLQDTLQKEFGESAVSAAANPLGSAVTGITDTVTTIAGLLAALAIVGIGLFVYVKGSNREAV